MKKELVELIKINSQSKNEQDISRVLQRKFSDLGLDVEEDNSKALTGHGSGNLICTLSGEESLRTIHFTAHMDTVAVPDDRVINPLLKDGYITSDGHTILGTDNKVGLVVMLETIRLLKENNMKHGTIQFVLTIGEESGLVGSKTLDTSLLNAHFGYAFDYIGSIGDIVTKSVEQMIVTLKISCPKDSSDNISAVQMATKLIKQLSLGDIDKDTAVHIVSFEGDEATNIQNKDNYDSVRLTIEIKSFNHDKILNEVKSIKQILNKLESMFDILSQVNTNSLYPGYHHKQSEQVVTIAERAAKNINLKPRYIKGHDASDANILSNYGIPTLNLAVDYEYIHTNKERYKIKNLEILTNFMISIIYEVAKSN